MNNDNFKTNYRRKIFAGYQLSPSDLLTFDGEVKPKLNSLITNSCLLSLASFKKDSRYIVKPRLLLHRGRHYNQVCLIKGNPLWHATDSFMYYLATRTTWRYITYDHQFDKNVVDLLLERKINNDYALY